MKLTINVTQDNIDKAERLSKCNCPIARAVKGLFVSDHRSEVTRSYASIDAEEGRMHSFVKDAEDRMQQLNYKFSLPEEATKFIRDRDAKQPIKPFRFSIEAQPYAQKLAHV